MSGNQLAADAKRGFRRSITRILGPRAVFFWGFIEEPAMVAAAFPSSKGLVKAMLEPVDWDNCKLFVEYGPGVGTFCPHILERLPDDGELLVIDTNPLFIDYLKETIEDPRFTAVLGSAEDVEKIVRAHGFERADFVLSGMPISTMPPAVTENILKATYRVLREGGAFLTYQYRDAAYRLTTRHFERTIKEKTYRNIPPCILAWGYKEPRADG
ncbi:MAG: class I SAM-dependent methyltransferase [Erythrobacter sp.]|uniref:class I SAM-dependent methyltransferase n=1 Tax=Erythrobacter sp. TaxID=1042 RepID=UPI003A8A1030